MRFSLLFGSCKRYSKCLPWMTGTAVNPLFRAAYLSKDGERKVTLIIPWLSLKDQEVVYPSKITFNFPADQEKYVRQWVDERTGFKSDFLIRFYPGKFSRDKLSIFAVGDISEIIPNDEADVAILEEPEHLTWFHHGKRWKTKFSLVIGIIHTNYLEYVKRDRNGMQAFLLKYVNTWVVNIYCHKIIRLSTATQDYSKSIVCNVHGVNPKFLEIGKKKILQQQQNENQAFSKGAYYIGKMVWSKGYKELLKLLRHHQKELAGLEVDLYGNGEDSDQIKEASKKLDLSIRVHPGHDHVDPLFHDYKVFLNPSTTDVVCTTTAEALAMGKVVVCANHPSNDFFKQFTNCRTYDNSDGFIKAICRALSDEPAQLTEAQKHELSWEAATERFLMVADLDHSSKTKFLRSSSKTFMSISLNLQKKIDDASAYLHNAVSGFEFSRTLFGAIPGSLKPDQEQCNELGLIMPSGKYSSKS